MRGTQGEISILSAALAPAQGSVAFLGDDSVDRSGNHLHGARSFPYLKFICSLIAERSPGAIMVFCLAFSVSLLRWFF